MQDWYDGFVLLYSAILNPQYSSTLVLSMLPLRDHEPSLLRPVVTVSLIGLNILAFFLEITAPNINAFIASWALVPAHLSVNNPQSIVPFVTSQFLHGGFAHIGFNMWYLWIFGDNVEGRLGHAKFLGFYLLAGIVAAVAELPFLWGSDIPMLGASGAIAGVLGMYLALFPHHRVDALMPTFLGFWTRVTLPAGGVLFFWFITQLFSGTASLVNMAASGGVAWWAHIGGFAFGWIFGRMLHAHPPAVEVLPANWRGRR